MFVLPQLYSNHVWYHRLIIPTLGGGQRQENQKFKITLSYTVNWRPVQDARDPFLYTNKQTTSVNKIK